LALLYYRYAVSAGDSIAPAYVEAFNLTKNIFRIRKQLNYDMRHNRKYEEIIFSSVYNREERTELITAIIAFIHNEILKIES